VIAVKLSGGPTVFKIHTVIIYII